MKHKKPHFRSVHFLALFSACLNYYHPERPTNIHVHVHAHGLTTPPTYACWASLNTTNPPGWLGPSSSSPLWLPLPRASGHRPWRWSPSHTPPSSSPPPPGPEHAVLHLHSGAKPLRKSGCGIRGKRCGIRGKRCGITVKAR